MKKLIAMILSFALILTCATVLAEETEEAATKTAHYQFRNLTGDTVLVFTITDNKTGEVLDLLSGEGWYGDDNIMYLTLYADENETEEDLKNRYTITFSNGSEEDVYEFKTLNFEDVLIDLLAVDAMTGATPIKFNTKMFQVGTYKIINNTDKKLESVTIKENADTNNNSTVAPMMNVGDR